MKKRFSLVLLTLVMVASAVFLTPSNFSVDYVTSQPQSSSFLDEDVEYLIITTELFEKDLERLALWKSMKGLNARIETVEDILLNPSYTGVDTQAKIKECITDYYINNGTEFVLLAGDHQHVPSRMVWIDESYSYDGYFVASDTYYADLDNDWDSFANGIYGEDNDDWNVTAEVYVGRLSANDEYEMGDLVTRILMYESTPTVGDWMNSTLFAGAMTYFDADYNSPGDGVLDYPEADANRFFNYVYDQFYTDRIVTFLAEDEGVAAGQSDYPHNDSLTVASLESEIIKGASIAGVFGHGNPSGIYRTIWDTDWDLDGLFDWYGEINEGAADEKSSAYMLHNTYSDFSAFEDKPSVMYLMGCSNGNFTHEEALTEYMLKEACIGTIGGHNIVWGEDNWTERSYGGWYDEGLAFRFYEQLDTYDQPGKAFALAKQDYMEDDLALNMSENTWVYEPKWSEKTLKQFNYFGDPELHIWTDIPETLDAITSGINSTSSLLEVSTSESGAIDDVTVTVTDYSNTVVWQGSTNSSGEVTLPYNSSILANYTVVAYKPTYIPSLSQELSPARPYAPVLSSISPSKDRDGNIDLEWTFAGAAEYFNIYRSLNEIPELDGLTPIANTTNLNYRDTGLTNGLYFYVVTAVNEGGESGASNNAMVQVKKLDIPGYSIPLAISIGCITLIAIAYSIVRKKRRT